MSAELSLHRSKPPTYDNEAGAFSPLLFSSPAGALASMERRAEKFEDVKGESQRPCATCVMDARAKRNVRAGTERAASVRRKPSNIGLPQTRARCGEELSSPPPFFRLTSDVGKCEASEAASRWAPLIWRMRRRPFLLLFHGGRRDERPLDHRQGEKGVNNGCHRKK